jgi:hypothetical protein
LCPREMDMRVQGLVLRRNQAIERGTRRIEYACPAIYAKRPDRVRQVNTRVILPRGNSEDVTWQRF